MTGEERMAWEEAARAEAAGEEPLARAEAAPAEPVRAQPALGEAARGESASAATAWEELVAAALLGTDRRPGVAPEAVLGAAAVHTVRRRAGLRARAAVGSPEAAPPDDRERLPEAARRRLGRLLAGRA
ncbi:MAG TPA: hypothetical protein VIU94_16840, partial [Streptomyces sp.]